MMSLSLRVFDIRAIKVWSLWLFSLQSLLITWLGEILIICSFSFFLN